MTPLLWIVGTAVLIGLLLISLFGTSKAGRQEDKLELARDSFHRRREWLEAKFATLAGQSGRPRGLHWSDCDFADDVTFARDRNTGDISAFVAVTIKFEAIEGGGMEDVEAVDNHKAATAVFTFGGDNEWSTHGRTVFNLNPSETIERFQNELEPLSNS